MSSEPTPDVEAILPLAPMQLGMLFHSVAAPGSGVYVTQVIIRLEGALDVGSWRTAWSAVCERHAALRASFLWHRRGEPIQIIRRGVVMAWQERDWSSADDVEQNRLLSGRLEEDRAEPFDLRHAPLTRHCLCRLGVDRYLHLWTFHHILLDGWSSQLLIDEAVERYAALRDGRDLDLPAPPSLRTYLQWLRQQSPEELRGFWSKAVADISAPTPLALAGASRGRIDAVQSGCVEAELPLESSERLREAARSVGVTLSTVVNAAWGLVLSNLAASDDVVFGVTHSGRQIALAGVTKVVGLLLNSVPLRLRFEWQQPLGDWLRALQTDQGRALAYGHLPLGEIKKLSGVPVDQPLFESLVVLESAPPVERSARGGIKIVGINYVDRTNVPLAALVHPRERLAVRINFDGERFDRWAVERLLDAFCGALQSLPEAVAGRLSEWSLMTAAARRRLLGDPPPGDADDASPSCVTAAIWRQARERPAAPAVRCGSQTLSYGELCRRAQRGADGLRALGVAAGNAVGLCMDPSVDLVVAVLAVLRAGAAYVPIDPRLPVERVRGMLHEIATTGSGAEPALVVTGDAHKERIPDGVARSVLLPELEGASPESGGAPPEATAVPIDALAYVLFTSGSSGAPKGVLVSRRNLASSTAARVRHYREPVVRFLLLSPLSFDSSVAGLFWTLVTGGELVVPGGAIERQLAELPALIERHAITHTLCLPAVYELILDTAGEGELRSLATVIVAGETCPVGLVAKHGERCPQTDLHNEYGPTEGTVWCTVHDMPAGTQKVNGERLPIGRPIPGAHIYIVNERLQLLPEGFVGEICIAGPGVARGYLNDAALTAQRFVTDPIRGAARLYRTGDLGRYRHDGTIEFLGRRDDQIKVRGMRMHLGEIESWLARYPAVDQAAVVPVPRGDEVALVAFLGAQRPGELSADGVRGFLAERLPAAMVPAQVHARASLPLLASGKVDRQRLMDDARSCSQPASRGRVSFVDPLQRKVAEVWSETLGLGVPDADDNFFEVGGDSLRAAVLIRDLNARLHTRLSVADLYDAPTVGGLTRRARSKRATEQWVSNVAIRADGRYAPLFLAYGNAQLLAAQLDPERPVYWLVHGRAGTVVPFESIASLAEKHLEQIRAVSAGGPYLLAGFSLGAIVALEIARRIETEGQRVSMLALIEPTSPFHYRVRGRHRRLQAMWAASLPLAEKLGYTLGFVHRLPGFVAERLRRGAGAGVGDGDPRNDPYTPETLDGNAGDAAPGAYHETQELPREEILRLVDEVMKPYPFAPYDGTAILLRAERGRSRSLEWRDEEVLWREIVRGGLTSELIPATRGHVQLFRDPIAVAALADRLEHYQNTADA